MGRRKLTFCVQAVRARVLLVAWLAGCRGVRAPDWNRARAINADGNYIKLFPIPPINKAFSIKVIEYLMRSRRTHSALRKY
jgi:hypothetical protein